MREEVSAIRLQRVEIEAKCVELSEILENIRGGYSVEDDIERRANAILETSNQAIVSARKHIGQDKENIPRHERGMVQSSQEGVI